MPRESSHTDTHTQIDNFSPIITVAQPDKLKELEQCFHLDKRKEGEDEEYVPTPSINMKQRNNRR